MTDLAGAAPRRRRATSADVAREAGVSRTTVSFVLNNSPHKALPEETRQRVLDAAVRLSYAPSAEARALSRGRSDVVLMILPPALPLTADVGELLEHLSASFLRKGLSLMTLTWTERIGVDTWTAVTPAAVIAWKLDDTDAEQMRRSGVNIVTSLTGSDAIGRWVTGLREDEIAQRQVDRLRSAGHLTLGYAIPDDDRLRDAAQLRASALERVCARYGLAAPIAVRVPHEPLLAAESVRSWRQASPPVTGICAHDAVAGLAVLAGAREAGLRVPEDFAVVGVNDSPAAALAAPPLTMVTIDAKTSADYIVSVVTSMLAGRLADEPGPTVTGVVERQSV